MDLTLLALTLRVAVVATIINLPFALAVSWLIVKRRVRFRFILDILVSLPLAVPPVAIGFILLVVFGRHGPVGSVVHDLLGADVVFTWVAATLASAVVSFPAAGPAHHGGDGGRGRADGDVGPKPGRRTH